jgi:hypothetical protein
MAKEQISSFKQMIAEGKDTIAAEETHLLNSESKQRSESAKRAKIIQAETAKRINKAFHSKFQAKAVFLDGSIECGRIGPIAAEILAPFSCFTLIR